MIAFVRGTLVEATPLRAVIDVGGVGYEVHIPVTTAEKLPGIGQTVTLQTLAVYREDAAALYGFATPADREFFQLMIEKVSGIGPRIALSLLSKLSAPVLQSALAQGDVKLLASCPGIGKKTAERLIIELKDKVAIAGTATGVTLAAGGAEAASALPESPVAEAVSALIALGYKAPDADKAIRKAADALGPDASTEALIRGALK